MLLLYLIIIFKLFVSSLNILCVGPEADNCQNEIYTDSQCQLVFLRGGVVNENMCENDQSWKMFAINCAKTCRICCIRKKDQSVCSSIGNVKVKCKEAKEKLQIIIYLSLKLSCPESCL
ncbi:hypothetical protein Mgra_00010003 [Meloidogyne graminicola]|uniref:ShKT domain-containing protein n=1 Tax=Meloidogyne graminicola TaxID=189291 RepID=A0A8S9ZAT7_9BILA|nr:hypothetical protein Mgra_00010003 [Meloidogyne graminicola]